MDKAEHHRADEHRHNVGHRTEQAPQLAPSVGLAGDLADLRERVAEKSAGEYAHHERRYAAVQKQLAEAQRALARLNFLHRHDRGEDHYKSVAHVRHHKSVEQNEKRSHQRVRVNAVV